MPASSPKPTPARSWRLGWTTCSGSAASSGTCSSLPRSSSIPTTPSRAPSMCSTTRPPTRARDAARRRAALVVRHGHGPEDTVWRHARTFLRVEYVRLHAGVVVESEERMYVASFAPERLSSTHWLHLVRRHRGVENNNHHTFDTAFAEDDRPWIEADADGMLAVLLLRRIAYTLLALFREVTLR